QQSLRRSELVCPQLQGSRSGAGTDQQVIGTLESMNYLDEIDHTQPGFGEWYDELPLWSAPFGLLLLDRVPIKSGLTILDVGAGTGFLTLELAQRCGPEARVFAVDPWKAGMSRLRRKLNHLGVGNVVLIE